MTQHRRSLAPIIAGLTLVAGTAHADAGTPLMWTAGFHLTFGNLVIGIVEGGVLALLFRIRWERWRIMIPANYISMIAGLVALGFLSSPFTFTIRSAHLVPTLGWVTFFVLTVLVEWPFGRWILRDQAQAWRRAFVGISLVNALSYAVLTPIYMRVSESPLLDQTTVDEDLVPGQSPDEFIFFISENGHDLCRIAMNGKEFTRLAALPTVDGGARLSATQVSDETWTLWIGDWYEPQQTRLVSGIRAECLSEWRSNPIYDYTADLRGPGPHRWDAACPHYAPMLFLKDNEMDEWRYLYVHSAFLMWGLTAVTNLPDDRVLFQLGYQIVLLDIPTMHMGLVTMGQWPIVALGLEGVEVTD